MRLDFPRVHLYFSRENRLFFYPFARECQYGTGGILKECNRPLSWPGVLRSCARGLGWNQGDPLHHQAKMDIAGNYTPTYPDLVGGVR